MDKPYVIAFCGIDGAGKSTQLNLLAESLEKQGYKVKISKIKLNSLGVIFKMSEKLYGDPYDYHPRIPPLIVQLAVAYDFAYHYLSLFEASQDYDFLLCDRHKLCYLAYAMAYGVEMDWIKKILDMVDDPDLVLYFDAGTDVTSLRLKNRIEKPQRADEDTEFLVTVKEKYELLLKDMSRSVRIEGDLGIEEVLWQIKRALMKCIEIKEMEKDKNV